MCHLQRNCNRLPFVCDVSVSYRNLKGERCNAASASPISNALAEINSLMVLETLLAFYCLLIVLMSTLGGQLPSLVRMSHLRTQLLISFVGGLMLGIAFLHLLPHAVSVIGSPSKAGSACLLGVVAMFVLLRAFHAPHTHGFAQATPLKLAEEDELVKPCCGEVPPEEDFAKSREQRAKVGKDLTLDEQKAGDPLKEGSGKSEPEDANKIFFSLYGQAVTHPMHEHCGHCGGNEDSVRKRWMGWLGILFGLWIHTLIDGVALAASTVADSQHPGVFIAGFGTFLAIALHKPLDAFTITSTMRAGGWPATYQSLINVIFALACPCGALLFYYGLSFTSFNTVVLGWALAISAGFFICIALADLLPEVSFHQHDRGKLSVAFFIGITLAFAVESLPGHSHAHGSQQPPAVSLEISETAAPNLDVIVKPSGIGGIVTLIGSSQ